MPNDISFPSLPNTLSRVVPANDSNVAATETEYKENDSILPDTTLHVFFAQAKGGYFGEIHKANDLIVVIGRTWPDFVKQLETHLRENG